MTPEALVKPRDIGCGCLFRFACRGCVALSCPRLRGEIEDAGDDLCDVCARPAYSHRSAV